MKHVFLTLLTIMIAAALTLCLAACGETGQTAGEAPTDITSAEGTPGTAPDPTAEPDATAAFTTDDPDIVELTGLYFVSSNMQMDRINSFSILVVGDGDYYRLRDSSSDRPWEAVKVPEGLSRDRIVTVRGKVVYQNGRYLDIVSWEEPKETDISVESVAGTILMLYNGMHYSFSREVLERAGYEFPREDSGEFVKNENYDAIATMVDTLSEGCNTVFSPLSFHFILRMLAEGYPSEAATAAMEDYFDVTKSEWRRFFNKYLRELPTDIRTTGAFLLRDGLEFSPEFRSDTEIRFNALCENTAFDEGLIDRVNQWASENTEGMITEMLRPEDLATVQQSDALALNALYYSGRWENGFDPKNTSEGRFYLADGTEIKADFMRGTEKIYLHNDEASGFMKYYEGGRFAFVGILPRKDKRRIKDFKLTELDIKGLLESRSDEEVLVEIPKFEFGQTHDITGLLDLVGLGALKAPDAFGGIVEGESLGVLAATQSARIRVDEEGTEAAAATGFFLTKSDDQNHLIFDRPFAFLIYDTETDTVLFAGKVMDLTE